MSINGHFPRHSDDLIDCAGPEGIPAVLTTLQKLAQRSRHPVVRVCLEQAYDDIVHLTSIRTDLRDADGESVFAADRPDGSADS